MLKSRPVLGFSLFMKTYTQTAPPSPSPHTNPPRENRSPAPPHLSGRVPEQKPLSPHSQLPPRKPRKILHRKAGICFPFIHSGVTTAGPNRSIIYPYSEMDQPFLEIHVLPSSIIPLKYKGESRFAGSFLFAFFQTSPKWRLHNAKAFRPEYQCMKKVYSQPAALRTGLKGR